MFGIIQNQANASADQKIHYGRAVEEVFLPSQSASSRSSFCFLPPIQ